MISFLFLESWANHNPLFPACNYYKPFYCYFAIFFCSNNLWYTPVQNGYVRAMLNLLFFHSKASILITRYNFSFLFICYYLYGFFPFCNLFDFSEFCVFEALGCSFVWGTSKLTVFDHYWWSHDYYRLFWISFSSVCLSLVCSKTQNYWHYILLCSFSLRYTLLTDLWIW